MRNFSINSKLINDIAVIYPNGYLNDIVGESLEKKCNEYLKSGVNKIVLNFDNIEFINSIGISILLGIMELMKSSKGDICFSNMNNLHKETFEMLGLNKHMNIFLDEDEALRHFRKKDQ